MLTISHSVSDIRLLLFRYGVNSVIRSQEYCTTSWQGALNRGGGSSSSNSSSRQFVGPPELGTARIQTPHHPAGTPGPSNPAPPPPRPASAPAPSPTPRSFLLSEVSSHLADFSERWNALASPRAPNNKAKQTVLRAGQRRKQARPYRPPTSHSD